MWPGAAVSGLYFAHPESHYFGVGKVERDQVEDYAARKGWAIEEAERWLAPVLNYDRQARPAARRPDRLDDRQSLAGIRGGSGELFGGKPMLSRLILLGLQLIAAWFAAPFIVRYIPGLGRMELFVFAVVFAVAGLARRPRRCAKCCTNAGMPTSSTLVSALIVALIGGGPVDVAAGVRTGRRGAMRASAGSRLSADRCGAGLSHQAISGAGNSSLACMTKARELLPAPLLP